MPKKMKACKNCNAITSENECKLCGSEVTGEWQGYLIVLEYQHSELARKMGIKTNGKFALKVRE